MLAITIMGVSTALRDRTLFFNAADAASFKPYLDFDRVRLNTAQFRLVRGDELFIVTRIGLNPGRLTWIGIYGFAAESETARPGGYKAVGVWLYMEEIESSALVPVLQSALQILDEKLDYVDGDEWAFRFGSLTLDGLGFSDQIVKKLKAPPILRPYVIGGIGTAEHLPDCCVELTDQSEDTENRNLYWALDELQHRREGLQNFRKAFVTGNQRLIGRAKSDGQLSFFRMAYPAIPAQREAEAGSNVLARRSGLMIVPPAARESDGSGYLMPQFKTLNDVIRDRFEGLDARFVKVQKTLDRQLEVIETQRQTARQLPLSSLIMRAMTVALIVGVLGGLTFVAMRQVQSIMDDQARLLGMVQAMKGPLEKVQPVASPSDAASGVAAGPTVSGEVSAAILELKKQLTNVDLALNHSPPPNIDELKRINKTAVDAVEKFLVGPSKQNPPSAAASMQDTMSGSNALQPAIDPDRKNRHQ